MTTVAQEYRNLISQFQPRFGIGEARAMAELIFHAFKGWGKTDILMHDDSQLDSALLNSFDKVANRILNGEPIQYVVGEGYFYGMWLKVDPRVLIPRPETSELIDMIVDRYGKIPDLQVLDLGTGSGCIAIALARALPFSSVTALDISPNALAVARENAYRLKAKVNFIEADMSQWMVDEDCFDIIVSNPPYIGESEKIDMESTVKDYEPAGALFVKDSDPLFFYRAISTIALRGLRTDGTLFLEINPLYADGIVSLLTQSGFKDVEIHLDIHGKQRFVIAKKTSNR